MRQDMIFNFVSVSPRQQQPLGGQRSFGRSPSGPFPDADGSSSGPFPDADASLPAPARGLVRRGGLLLTLPRLPPHPLAAALLFVFGAGVAALSVLAAILFYVEDEQVLGMAGTREQEDS